MKKKVWSPLLVIVIVHFVYQLFSLGLENVLSLVFSIITACVVVYFGMKSDEMTSSYVQVKREKEELEHERNMLKEKNKDLDLLFDSFEGSAIYIYDFLDKQVTFSKGMEHLFGYTPNEFIHSFTVKRLVHPSDSKRVQKSENDLLKGETVQVEFRIDHPVFDEKWIRHEAKPIKNSSGAIVKINGQYTDITKQKAFEKELKYMAFFDDLTDLPNRKMLDRHIEKALARSRRHEHNFTLMFVDLDDFKIVNDSLGHDAGDELLQEVVIRLNKCIREEDLIARIGGDEFIILFEETSKQEIEGIAERVIEKVSEPYQSAEEDVAISLSIGVSMYPDDGETKETLIKNADKAMYYAKNNGKCAYKLYTPDLEEVELNEVGIFGKWMNMLQNTKFFK